MRDPVLRSFSSLSSTTDSWLQRVRENFRQIVATSHFRTSAANGAPIHLVQYEKSRRPARAQSASLLTHAALMGLILLVAANPPVVKKDPHSQEGPRIALGIPENLARILGGNKAAQGNGSGGDQNPIPAKNGDLAPRSSIQIVRPTLPQNQPHDLPVPPTIFDATAAAVLTPVQNIGLPWMKDATQSAGPGTNHGIGQGPGNGMGDTLGDGEGNSLQPGVYHPGGTRPSCAYCPDPQYTDAAREAKLQGTVTMEVLVGADGHALRIQLVKGVGTGLDERAMEAVKTWKFAPGRDAAHRAVAEWVTIEAMFRLF